LPVASHLVSPPHEWGTQARTIDLTPGKYLFVCNIPGHFKQGMYTVVTVKP
jgi:uncharacterized cupredoxin-like copper-binding protein